MHEKGSSIRQLGSSGVPCETDAVILDVIDLDSPALEAAHGMLELCDECRCMTSRRCCWQSE